MESLLLFREELAASCIVLRFAFGFIKLKIFPFHEFVELFANNMVFHQTPKTIQFGYHLPTMRFVVHELIKNSLEANAKNIEVILGCRGVGDCKEVYIRVEDDGNGFDLAILKGFVAQTGSLTTKENHCGSFLYWIHELTRKITIHSNNLRLTEGAIRYDRWMTKTIISLEDLFYSIPIRKKVLNFDQEMKAIIEDFQHFQLVYPRVCLKLNHLSRNKILYRSFVSQDSVINQQRELLRFYVPESVAQKFRTLKYKNLMHGFITDPTDKIHELFVQKIFVNGLYVSDSNIISLLKDWFVSLKQSDLSRKGIPNYLLFFCIPKNEVACSISGKGSCVSYSVQLSQTQEYAIKEVLKSLSSRIFETLGKEIISKPLKTFAMVEQKKKQESKKQESFGPNLLFQRTKQSYCTPIIDIPINADLQQSLRHSIKADDLQMIQAVGQVDQKFLIGYIPGKGIVSFDQHAVDERIRLEELEDTIYSHGGLKCSRVCYPKEITIRLSLNALEKELISQHQHELKQYFWSIESLRNGEYLLKSIPHVLGVDLGKKELCKYLAQLGSNYSITLRPIVIQKIINSKACRSAIMFGDFLSLDQCQQLFNALKLCRYPFICAHGRRNNCTLKEELHIE